MEELALAAEAAIHSGGALPLRCLGKGQCLAFPLEVEGMGFDDEMASFQEKAAGWARGLPREWRWRRSVRGLDGEKDLQSIDEVSVGQADPDTESSNGSEDTAGEPDEGKSAAVAELTSMLGTARPLEERTGSESVEAVLARARRALQRPRSSPCQERPLTVTPRPEESPLRPPTLLERERLLGPSLSTTPALSSTSPVRMDATPGGLDRSVPSLPPTPHSMPSIQEVFGIRPASSRHLSPSSPVPVLSLDQFLDGSPPIRRTTPRSRRNSSPMPTFSARGSPPPALVPPSLRPLCSVQRAFEPPKAPKAPHVLEEEATDTLSRAEAILQRARVALANARERDPLTRRDVCLQEPEGEAEASLSPQVTIEATMETQEPDRVASLQQQVAELREDVRRIENTVTSLNPEPEEEKGCDGPLAEPVKAAETPEAPDSRLPAKGRPKAPPRLPQKGSPPPVPDRLPGPKGAAQAGSVASQAKARKKFSVPTEAPFHRKLYWKPIDLADPEGTIFSDRDVVRRRSTFDAEALKRMFDGEKTKGTERVRRSTLLLSSAQKRSLGLKVLSDHRARNIAIILKRLPVTPVVLARILRDLRWEEVSLSADDLEQIMEVIPTQEEAANLSLHQSEGARENLRDVEQLVIPLSLVTRGAVRVRVLCSARSARANFAQTAKAFKSIREACASIHASLMLREVMLLALDLGNYINHGDRHAGARAISIGSLSTLKDFKAGGRSSLHFLCACLHLADPNRDAAEVLARELRPVVHASGLQVQTIMSAARSFERDHDLVESECKNYMHEYRGSTEGGEEAEDMDELDRMLLEEGKRDGKERPVAAGAWTEAEDLDELEATRFVEDVAKVRGSAARRLRCMRSVLEKLCKMMHEDLRNTSKVAQTTLRFCGMNSPATKELPNDMEPLVQQLGEFIKTFSSHYKEVRSDLPLYRKLFESSPEMGRPEDADGETPSGSGTGWWNWVS